MKSPAPIKRYPALVALSRDHHFGLLLTWKIRQGLKKGVEPWRISPYVLFFFQNDLKHHFREEETTLFVKLPAESALRVQAEGEHLRLNQLVKAIEQSQGDTALLTQFADALESHIRFEERTLFNYMQQCLSQEELDNLPAHSTQTNLDDQWEDHFWETKE